MSWTLKNDQATTTGSTPANLTAFANALTNPSQIWVMVIDASGGPIATPTDTAGNTYYDSGAGLVYFLSSGRALQVFYALNTSTTASNVVSTSNPSGHGLVIEASEWTGGATFSPVDAYATNPNANSGTGGGQNMTSNSATTNNDGDLILGYCEAPAGTVTLGTGFTGLQTSSPSHVKPEYEIQSSHGSIAATWSDNTNNDNYGAIMVASKAYSTLAPDEDFRAPLVVQSSDLTVTVWG